MPNFNGTTRRNMIFFPCQTNCPMALLDTLHFPIPNTLRKNRLYFIEMVFSIECFEKRKTMVIALEPYCEQRYTKNDKGKKDN